MRFHGYLAAVGATIGVAQVPQPLVVPAAYSNLDAPARVWLPGAGQALRQQTLVGPSHLTALLGRQLTALEFRRNADQDAYAGGAADWRVVLSTSAREPLTASTQFVDNAGSDAMLVYQGRVTLPASPAPTGPTVAWSAINVVRIAFQQPFVYRGGTLCVDITGSLIAGQVAGWWLADTAFEDISGTAVDIGPGCGPRTNALGQWSFASPRSLLAGSRAELTAYGPPGSLGLALLGDSAVAPIELTSLGLPSPGCFAHLASASSIALAPFTPETHPLLVARGGRAEWSIPIPNETWVLGAQTVAQWLELSQLQASNAIRLTVAASRPTLDMALVNGAAGDVGGTVCPYMAHVLRFDWQ